MEELRGSSSTSTNNQKGVTTPVSDELRKGYEEKYLDESPQALNSLVAPQTSGAKILDLFGFKKEGDVYPEFQNKQVTDIGGGLSSLAFELSPSAKQIIVVDPIFAYDRKAFIERESMRAGNRIKIFDTLDANAPEDMLTMREENKKNTQEVAEGIKKWQEYDTSHEGNIQINDSFAQNLQGIEDNSQDVTFLNFVLDKLNSTEGKREEIILALENAYRITKTGGKIYGIHGKGDSEDDIISALNDTNYKRDGNHKGRYMYFVIDKQP